MKALRRAAAALYGLHHDDREAILAQLSPHEQQALRPALAELASLGFTRSIGAMLEADAHPAKAVSDGDETVARLMSADAQHIERVLLLEPPALVAELLQAARWPWAAPFVDRLPAGRRKEVSDLLFAANPVPVSRKRWLLRMVADRLAEELSACVAEPALQVGGTARRIRWFPWRA